MTQLRRAVVEAPAKLNLALDITGEDGQGYHLLDTVMLAVNLCDTLTLELREEKGLTVACTDPSVPKDESNLAAKAARVFWARTGLSAGLAIHIEKRIPTRAGLAGGSADAAAVLAGLNRLFGEVLEPFALAQLALEVGSDVPFCLVGKCARATGRGEKLQPLPLPGKVDITIAKPGAGMSTREAFARYDSYRGKLPRPDIPGLVEALLAGNSPEVGRRMGNVFTPVCAPPQVGELLNILRAGGALGAEMTGTGTAVAGLFGNELLAARCLRALGKAEFACLCRPANYGARVQKLG